MTLTKLSLFSGILGDDLASEWAGIETVCCVEIDPFCLKVIKKHYPDMPIIGDIHEVTKAKLKEVSGYERVDIISGGDPCQPRSIAGKRRGREDDRDLWPEMFRVVCEFRPTWVVNENPTGRLTMDFHEVLSDLESQGYETRSFVIPASAVAAPHRRDRLFIVAYGNSGFNIQPKESVRSGRDSTFYGGKFTTDTNRERRPQREDEKDRERWNKQTRLKSSEGNIVTSNPKCNGLQRRIYRGNSKSQRGSLQQGCSITRGTYEAWNKNWFEVATALCGMDDGFSNRVARLKALGNACVPQQVYPIYRAIVRVSSLYSGSGEKPTG